MSQLQTQTLPQIAEVVSRQQETATIFTLRLKFTDPAVADAYDFAPGQFNMLYLFGVGEVPISIVSDPENRHEFAHTIRVVGRVTAGIAKLQPGDQLGIRGPFGRGWPMEQARGKDILVVTGGLGCAPTVSVIHYVLWRREQFGRLNIIQGLKHADDMIWREQYDYWRTLSDVSVRLAADVGSSGWPWHVGRVTELFDDHELGDGNAVAMMCGPEGMMTASARALLDKGYRDEAIYLSLERNMQCGNGRCGHCQLGSKFVCTDGPVFRYTDVRHLLEVRGL